MRTTQDLLEYVDPVIYVGVDKMETESQFALIEMQSVKQDEGCEKMLVPLVENTDEQNGSDGKGMKPGHS